MDDLGTPLAPAVERQLLAAKNVEAIVRAYEGMAYWAVRDLYAPGLDHDDLLQEARIGIAKAVRDWHSGGKAFKHFAAMCARRNAISAVQGARAQKHRPVSFAADIHADDEHVEPCVRRHLVLDRDPLTQLLDRERANAMLTVVADDMSEIERKALLGQAVGTRGHGGQFADLAAELGVKPKAIDNARQRARKKLALVAAA